MASVVTVNGIEVWDDDLATTVSQLGVSESEAASILKSYGKMEGLGYGRGDRMNQSWYDNYKADVVKDEAAAENTQNMEDLFRLSAEYGRQQVLQSEESVTRMIENNIERFEDKIDPLARESSMGAASEINAFMRDEFNVALDDLYPDWRDQISFAGAEAQGDSIALTKRFRDKVMPGLLDSIDEMSIQALGMVSSMLDGQVPDDVGQQLKIHAAEIAGQIGVRGQAAQYLTTRDLGIKSLDLQMAGLQAAPSALNLAPSGYATVNQTLQMPVATGTALTNLLSAYRAPQVDAGALYGGQLNLLAGAGTVNATSAYSTAAQVVSNAGSQIQNQLQFGTQYSSQQYWNQMNYQQNQQALAMAGQGGKTPWGQIAGSLIGAGVGAWATGGAGAGVGAQVGGSLGSAFS
jgi:hypothetical protein